MQLVHGHFTMPTALYTQKNLTQFFNQDLGVSVNMQGLYIL